MPAFCAYARGADNQQIYTNNLQHELLLFAKSLDCCCLCPWIDQVSRQSVQSSALISRMHSDESSGCRH